MDVHVIDDVMWKGEGDIGKRGNSIMPLNQLWQHSIHQQLYPSYGTLQGVQLNHMTQVTVAIHILITA